MSNIPPPPPGSPGPGQPQYPPTQQFPGAPAQPQPAYGPPGSQPPAGPGGSGGPPPGRGGGGLPPWAWVLGAVVLIGLGVGAFFLFSGDDDDDEAGPDTSDEVVTDETDGDLTVPVDTGGTDFTLPNMTMPTVPDITAPDFTAPDTSTGGDLFDQLRDQLITIGLSEEQADCVIEEAIDLGMNSGGEEPDMEQVFDLYEQCGVDLNDLQPGG